MSRQNRNGGVGVEAVEQLESRRLLSAGDLEVFAASALGLFVENRGQWSDSQVRYSYQSAGAAAALTDSGMLFQLSGAPNQGSSGFRSVQFSASFVGASATRPVGTQQVEGRFNYYLGDPSQHRSGVPGFEQVVYSELYSGVDLYTSGQRGQLKYEFHVAPGADYQQVRIGYSGIEGLSIAADGSLHIQTAAGEMVESAPVLYQQIAGRRQAVAGRFVLVDGSTYGFEVTGEWDAGYELVLDRELTWSTHLEGTDRDEAGTSVAVDGEGNVLVTGQTSSAGWVSGEYDTSYNGEADAFVAKLSASGVRLWSTYLGGNEQDYGGGVRVDEAGNVFVTGATCSAGWVSGGYDTSYGGGEASYLGDAFVAKLSSSGEHLWSTYLGGAGWDWGTGIAVDGTGDVLVTGTTRSSGWTSGGYDTTHGGGGDAFVVKLSSSGQHLWSTYLGGDVDSEQGYAIAADASGNVLVTGETYSYGWVSGGYDTSYGTPVYNGFCDGFVVKLSSSGQHLWSTYLGGNETDRAISVAVDEAGNVLVTGRTDSAGWVSGGYDTSHGGSADAFVVKLSASGQHLWSTYLGGDDTDGAVGVAVDEVGNVFATGWTGSSGWVSGGVRYELRRRRALFRGGRLRGRALLFGSAPLEHLPGRR